MTTTSGPALPGDREIATSSFAEPADRPTRLPDVRTNARSVPEVANAVAADVSLLVKDHVALAKVEIQASAKTAGTAVGMFGGAAALGYFSVFMFLVAAAEGLAAAGIWRWAAYLIVGVVLVLVAALLGVLGRGKLKKVKGLPRTKSSVERTKVHVTTKAKSARRSG